MAKQRDSAAWIKKAIKDHRAGMERGGKPYEDRVSKGLTDDLAEGGFDAVKVLSVRLSLLAPYYGRRGSVSVIDGDSKGWVQVDRAAKYRVNVPHGHRDPG